VAAVGLDKLRRSFQYALAGLVYALKTQRNVRIHFMAAVIVLGAGLYFRISSRDFVLLFFAITLVFMAELFNTSLEKAVDLFVQEYSHLAKVAKDTAAGAVLVTALNALVVAYVVFYPRLESWILPNRIILGRSSATSPGISRISEICLLTFLLTSRQAIKNPPPCHNFMRQGGNNYLFYGKIANY
jgi:diacylglycerol kinase